MDHPRIAVDVMRHRLHVLTGPLDSEKPGPDTRELIEDMPLGIVLD